MRTHTRLMEPNLRYQFGCAFATCLLSGMFALADEGGQWISLAPMSIARQETGAARIGNSVYVVGGLLAGFPFTATDTVEAYDITLDEWSFIKPMPEARDHMGCVSIGQKLYVIGGYSGDFNARVDVWEYDPTADKWSSVAPLPEARGACWTVAHEQKIYVFGGAAWPTSRSEARLSTSQRRISGPKARICRRRAST